MSLVAARRNDVASLTDYNRHFSQRFIPWHVHEYTWGRRIQFEKWRWCGPPGRIPSTPSPSSSPTLLPHPIIYLLCLSLSRRWHDIFYFDDQLVFFTGWNVSWIRENIKCKNQGYLEFWVSVPNRQREKEREKRCLIFLYNCKKLIFIKFLLEIVE